MTWWPRQTPSRGRPDCSDSCTRLRQIPVSVGWPGPGLSRTPFTASVWVTETSSRVRTSQTAPSSRRYWTMVKTKLSWLSTTRTLGFIHGAVVELDARLQPREQAVPEHGGDQGDEDQGDQRLHGRALCGQVPPDPEVHQA